MNRHWPYRKYIELTLEPTRLRRPLPEPEPDQALLAELRRLPQVHQRQGRGLQALPSGTFRNPSCSSEGFHEVPERQRVDEVTSLRGHEYKSSLVAEYARAARAYKFPNARA